MIDDKKMGKAIEDYVRYSPVEDEYPGTEGEAFKAGAKWAINEFLKDLWHPASEEPKNLEYIIFASEIFGETYFFTVQRDNSKQSWETEVTCHGINQWAYRNDIVSLILKGGNHD